MGLTLREFDAVAPAVRRLYVDGAISHRDLVFALGQLAAAETAQDVELLLERLPLPFVFTPPEQQLADALVLEARHSQIAMRGAWQVGRTTRVHLSHGFCLLDFSHVQLDDRLIDLSLDLSHSSAKILVPEVLNVTISRMAGGVSIAFDQRPAVAGLPTLRIGVSTRYSSVVLMRPDDEATGQHGSRRSRQRRRVQELPSGVDPI